MTPTPPPHTPIAAFWADLGIQQGWMNEPVLMSDDPIWKMTAKEGYLFDDAFWEVFERHPFRICHVTYSGAPWSLEGGPPEMVLRFTRAEAAPAGGLRDCDERVIAAQASEHAVGYDAGYRAASGKLRAALERVVVAFHGGDAVGSHGNQGWTNCSDERCGQARAALAASPSAPPLDDYDREAYLIISDARRFADPDGRDRQRMDAWLARPVHAYAQPLVTDPAAGGEPREDEA